MQVIDFYPDRLHAEVARTAARNVTRVRNGGPSTLDHLLSSAIPWPSTFLSLRPVLPNHLQAVALPHCRACGTAFPFSATRCLGTVSSCIRSAA
jgi:hypothetical protein